MDDFKSEIMQLITDMNNSQLMKLDEIKANFDVGQNNLSSKIDDLRKTTEGLSCRIEEVNGTFSRSLTILEQKVDDAVLNLRETDQQIVAAVDLKEKSLLEQIDSMKTRIVTYDTQLYATRLVLNATQERLEGQRSRMVALERAVYRNMQHGREWNVEIDGIPVNVGDEPNQLQEAALKIFNAINVPVQKGHIDAIHRLNSPHEPKPTIIRFHSRKIVKDIFVNTKKLKNIQNLRLDIPGNTDESQIFVRASQCPYYRTIAFNCRELRRKGRLEKFSTGIDGKISIKIGQNWHKILHENDLIYHFPNFNGFSFKNPYGEMDFEDEYADVETEE